MDERLRKAYLYDFYGELLTQRQQDIFQMHFCEDMSLAEIGERCGISRQAVNDALKQGQKTLDELELTLGLVASHFALQRGLSSVDDALARNDFREARLILKELMEG